VPEIADELNVGVLMFISYRAMEATVMNHVAAAGHADITLAQARLLQRIGVDGSRVTDLAEQAQVTKQTAKVIVDQLEQRGYVLRVADPSDGRARLVQMTEAGFEVCQVANRAAGEVEAEWRRHLGRGQMAALRSALIALREVTDPFR
jgi:DNA-binding MarR family transcriptional regulator